MSPPPIGSLKEHTHGYRGVLDEAYALVLARYLRAGSVILELEAARRDGAEILLCQRLMGLASYVCVDVSSRMRESKRPENECIVADCKHLPFREQVFDLVHITFPSRGEYLLFDGGRAGCTFSSEYVASSIDGVERVLKEDGVFVVFPFLDEGDTWQIRLEEELFRRGFTKTSIPLLNGRDVAAFNRT